MKMSNSEELYEFSKVEISQAIRNIWLIANSYW